MEVDHMQVLSYQLLRVCYTHVMLDGKFMSVSLLEATRLCDDILTPCLFVGHYAGPSGAVALVEDKGLLHVGGIATALHPLGLFSGGSFSSLPILLSSVCLRMRWLRSRCTSRLYPPTLILPIDLFVEC
mgnify:CR=1 FL=1